MNTAGVTATNVAANGGPPTWDQLVDSVGRVRDAAEEPTAQILADRTARSLAKAKDSAGQYLSAPSYLDGVRRLTTSGIPINLTTGRIRTPAICSPATSPSSMSASGPG